ncbi:hypothetical protein DL769_007320 [Monosporascus sp. CRB-8-3]|nr:hypothetical protein DL769_007320 [Monosporascus sp. CRB-8-3]
MGVPPIHPQTRYRAARDGGLEVADSDGKGGSADRKGILRKEPRERRDGGPASEFGKTLSGSSAQEDGGCVDVTFWETGGRSASTSSSPPRTGRVSRTRRHFALGLEVSGAALPTPIGTHHCVYYGIPGPEGEGADLAEPYLSHSSWMEDGDNENRRTAG